MRVQSRKHDRGVTMGLGEWVNWGTNTPLIPLRQTGFVPWMDGYRVYSMSPYIAQHESREDDTTYTLCCWW